MINKSRWQNPFLGDYVHNYIDIYITENTSLLNKISLK